MGSAVPSPFTILARYEQLALVHAFDSAKNRQSIALWRGIAYRAGHANFVSDLEEINELLFVPVHAPVAGAFSWLLGVTQVRRKLLPVVDLGSFLFGEQTVFSKRNRLLLVPQGGGEVALLVNEVFGQRTVETAQHSQIIAEDDPQMSRFVQGRIRLEEESFTVLSMKQLTNAAAFRQAGPMEESSTDASLLGFM